MIRMAGPFQVGDWTVEPVASGGNAISRAIAGTDGSVAALALLGAHNRFSDGAVASVAAQVERALAAIVDAQQAAQTLLNADREIRIRGIPGYCAAALGGLNNGALDLALAGNIEVWMMGRDGPVQVYREAGQGLVGQEIAMPVRSAPLRLEGPTLIATTAFFRSVSLLDALMTAWRHPQAPASAILDRHAGTLGGKDLSLIAIALARGESAPP